MLESRAMAARGSGAGEFEAVIGLEVHAQLKTDTKIFCSCRNRFGDPPNTHVCPVCVGLPGALPVLSRQAVTLALRAALATGCQIQPCSVFERKNYFYPDLPKGYQISQYERPLAVNGFIEFAAPSGSQRVHLNRIHMEEDAGKLLHEGFAWSEGKSGVDLNRAGVPLIEIVSEPDITSPEQAFDYLSALKAVLRYADVSDCNMEEGSLRCDANVSIRPRGGTALETRTEIKNLNSFRNVARALEHEIARQSAVRHSGGQIVQETRLWNAERGETVPMRSKEEAHDYRYFPEPDLPPLLVDRDWIETVRASLPELPTARRQRFCASYGLSPYDAGVLTADRLVADYYEAVVRESRNAKAASNWVMTDVLRKLKEGEQSPADCPVPPGHLAEMILLIDGGPSAARSRKTSSRRCGRRERRPDRSSSARDWCRCRIGAPSRP